MKKSQGKHLPVMKDKIFQQSPQSRHHFQAGVVAGLMVSGCVFAPGPFPKHISERTLENAPLSNQFNNKLESTHQPSNRSNRRPRDNGITARPVDPFAGIFLTYHDEVLKLNSLPGFKNEASVSGFWARIMHTIYDMYLYKLYSNYR